MAIQNLKIKNYCQILLVVLFFISPRSSKGEGRYGEILLPFQEKKIVTFYENKKNNSIIIEFLKTSYQELESLNLYDEKLIKRVLIKDLGPEGTKVHLFLQDRNLKATLDVYNEPFRVSITIFDYSYKQEKNPHTGLPLLALNTNEDSQNNNSESISLKSEPNELNKVNTYRSIQTGKRKLLQPTPDPVKNKTDLKKSLQSAGVGKGEAWKKYPYYIFPIQTATLAQRKQPAGWKNNSQNQALTHSQSMAEYAYKLFSFGDEKKALLAYQQVLFEDPSIFEKDVLHLWSFAECQLGQENLALADGYYDSIINKFPETPFANFAYIRRLDIQSIQILADQRPEDLSQLSIPLNKLKDSSYNDLNAHKYIRMAYWQPPLPNHFQDQLPLTRDSILKKLKENHYNLESKKTAFLTASILLKNNLQSENNWDNETAKLAKSYFDLYDEETGKPFYNDLKKDLQSVLSKTLVKLSNSGKFSEAIEVFESIPESVQKIKNTSQVAWAIAEAYRNLSQDESSIPLYKIAINKSKERLRKFKSLFWYTILASRVSEQLGTEFARKKDDFKKQAIKEDLNLKKSWDTLNDQEKNEIKVSYKDRFKETLQDKILLKTPPIIILESWENALGSEMNLSADEGDELNGKSSFSPSANSVHLFKKLIERFRKLGLNNERKRATKLLKKIKPQSLQGDKEAQKIWSTQLLDLADEYRENNQYLEAGELFSFTAKESVNLDRRAESLYKGGLLLYKAGKRKEAVETLTLASQDGNNLFYANLAKERLTQLKQ